MRILLGEEYGAFEAALGEPSVKGVRVNEGKTTYERFNKIWGSHLTPILYARGGFIPDGTEGIGQTPEHHAGMIYVQDPGAMATVNALDIPRGFKVLDACAAPGGKSSQLADMIGDEGVLLSNEYMPKRAKIIVSNFERLGIKNAVVTSLDTAKIAEMFDSYFDLVLCDAPCSGEGMFRKYDVASEEWSVGNVTLSAKRQSEIISNCAKTVKAGGYLLYSTCTYSVEENEGVIADFLDTHPDFKLIPVRDELVRETADGITTEAHSAHPLHLTRRFYPHLSRGEGQFIALMKRDEDPDALPTIIYKESISKLSKEEETLTKRFLLDNIDEIPSGRFIKQGDYVILVPHSLPIPPYSVFMAGVTVGEIRKGVFFPHHQFFSAYGRSFKRRLDLKKDDPRLYKYLRGEEICTEEISGSGYTAVLFEGAPLGGGKLTGVTLKNHYPKGLRNNR